MDRQQQILTWASAFVLGISLGRWLRQCRDSVRNQFQSIAARSALWIAALRAVESLENDDALFVDEMASSLAGKGAFGRALKMARPVEGQSGKKRLYKMTEVALGTWWFDRQIMTIMTTNTKSSARGWLSARLRNSAFGLAGPPRQVVVIGSGMDTRPWRMALPPMTKWLEIDTDEVVYAKKRGLEASDVSEEIDWVRVLDSHGFELDQPVVWVLENVLMYLSQENVKSLLETLSEVSKAKGSVVIGNSTVNRTAALLAGNNHEASCGSYPADMVESWLSSLPRDPEIALHEAGWEMTDCCTQFDIAQDVCNGAPEDVCRTWPGHAPDDEVGCDVYFVANKL
eukprot:jgi/Picre1/33166/NNA_008491.t1